MEPTLIKDVLDEVCQTRETLSAVTLAVDLVDRGRLQSTGDPVGLLSMLIAELAEAGLVTYKLRRSWSTIPLHIRATPLGFSTAGYSRETIEVGTRRATHGAPLHLGPTDFRSQPSATWGGPIERESLIDHLDRFPEHRSIHPSPYECGPYRSLDMAAKRVDHSARVASTLWEIGEPATWSELNERLGGVQSSTHRMLGQAIDAGYVKRADDGWRLTPAGKAKIISDTEETTGDIQATSESTRDAILRILEREGRMPTVNALLVELSKVDARYGSLGVHSLDHQLWSMQKRGLVTFAVTRNGNAQVLTKIELNDAASFRRTAESETTVDSIASVVPVPNEVLEDAAQVREAVEDVMLHRYPVLDSLRERAKEQGETNRRVDAYLSAASALESVDEPESARLLALASEIATSEMLSAAEVEYLRYANDHPIATDGEDDNR